MTLLEVNKNKVTETSFTESLDSQISNPRLFSKYEGMSRSFYYSKTSASNCEIEDMFCICLSSDAVKFCHADATVAFIFIVGTGVADRSALNFYNIH